MTSIDVQKVEGYEALPSYIKDEIESVTSKIIAAANDLNEKCFSITVSSEDDTQEIKEANKFYKEANKLLKEVEAKRKEIKDPFWNAGKAIDQLAKDIKSVLTPAFDHIKLQKDFVKNKKAEELAKNIADRKAIYEAIEYDKLYAHLKPEFDENSALAMDLDDYEIVVKTKRDKIIAEAAEEAKLHALKLEREKIILDLGGSIENLEDIEKISQGRFEALCQFVKDKVKKENLEAEKAALEGKNHKKKSVAPKSNEPSLDLVEKEEKISPEPEFNSAGRKPKTMAHVIYSEQKRVYHVDPDNVKEVLAVIIKDYNLKAKIVYEEEVKIPKNEKKEDELW